MGVRRRPSSGLQLAVTGAVLLTAAACSGPPARAHAPARRAPTAVAVGTVLVPEGKYSVALVPVTPSERGCVRTARRLGYPVPCPAKLPQAALGANAVCLHTVMSPGWIRGCGPGPRVWRGWMVADGGEAASGPGLNASTTEHLVMEASPSRTTSGNLIANGPGWASLGRPHTVRALGWISIGGRRMRWIVVTPDTGGSAMAGHLMLVWATRSHTHALGFHILWGIPVARALDLAVASHLVMVGRS